MTTDLSALLLRPPAPAGQVVIAARALDAVQALRQAVVDADWGAVRVNAHASLAWGNELARVVRAGSQHQLSSTTAQDLRRIASGRHASRLRGYAASLSAKNPDLAARFGDALAALADGQLDDNPLLAALDASQPAAAALGLLPDTSVAARVRGLQGLVHDAYQRVFVAADPFATALAGRVDAPLRQVVEQAEQEVRGLQLELYHSAGGLLHVAESVLSSLAEFLVRLAPALARGWRAAAALQAAGKGGASERVGLWTARGAGALREGLATFAACARIVVAADAELSEQLCAASGLTFDARLPDGKNTELSKLSSVAEGKLVEVHGFVQRLDVERAEKLVSRATLRDPSSDSTFTVVIPYTHLPHRGVVQGAYVLAHGYYRAASVFNDGAPAVELDRLSLAELAEASWHVRLLRLAAPWFERWPNGMHADWSLGPHRLPTDERPSADHGACELIYSPLTRGDR